MALLMEDEMNLDHIGPTNAMRRALELQNRKKKPENPAADLLAAVANAPSIIPVTLGNCYYLYPLLTASRFNVMPGRIRKIIGRTLKPGGSDEIKDLQSFEVKAINGSIVSLDPKMVVPCDQPPNQPKWVIALTTATTPQGGKIVVAGKVYKIRQYNPDKSNFWIWDNGTEHYVTAFNAENKKDPALVEVCHGPILDNCNKVKCIKNDEVENYITIGKVYDVLGREDDGVFIKVKRDDGKEMAYNRKFFGVFEE